MTSTNVQNYFPFCRIKGKTEKIKNIFKITFVHFNERPSDLTSRILFNKKHIGKVTKSSKLMQEFLLSWGFAKKIESRITNSFN